MLKTLLTPDVVQVIPQVKDWREAIKIACQPLIDKGCIEPRYVDAIYKSHEQIGPYYVLGPGIAMPHARPEEGVNQLSLALTIIEKGVEFGADENDPVKLLIVLAAIDNDSHINAIVKLAELFDNQDDIDTLLQAKSKAEVLAVINHY
ncbi:TPA: PTS sugar transporter subunit IIA [Proteus mirabilis]|uniref:PTS sugar transporter subunit IIA n=1 Tax=Proteus mirabilis TaxID=584 RepID=UPI001A224714|nr:PTS sugar transporter subunit IIA [Proteus mirabilis]MBI6377999.1 PTS sugar transporter subunit IIA [Proteus mirabilis]MCL8618299.1 PTS sugar transporter subunit IIA [Proteus mirabilis]MCL8629334.1 PTS sugar transporter subunit IIA [Proteus mirabilis]MCU9581068.1 PTS sugar transporter subunit IIA [Proteus mirabilis]HBC5067614.1 PTS sugar transporter subunit IIA [Proteus mirabilis]